MLREEEAKALDEKLVACGFSIAQLMEIAGVSSAQAIHDHFYQKLGAPSVLVVCGPGNNGGDGLVLARYLKLFAWNVAVLYPTKSKCKDKLYESLIGLLGAFGVPVIDALQEVTTRMEFHLIVDAVFGFSFKSSSGIRPPFDEILTWMAESRLPIASIDVPSGWDVEHGPKQCSVSMKPAMLISLSAPKGCAQYLPDGCIHVLAGRFIPEELSREFPSLGPYIVQYSGSSLYTILSDSKVKII